MLPIKTITSVLWVSTYIITCIIALPIGLAAILVIMSVSTYTPADILYVHCLPVYDINISLSIIFVNTINSQITVNLRTVVKM